MRPKGKSKHKGPQDRADEKEVGMVKNMPQVMR
jgi:hypothetical protein